MLNGIDTIALADTITAIRSNPGLANVTFSLQSAWDVGCRQRSKTGDLIQNGQVVPSRQAQYALESDEPTALLGTDTATSPGEYILQALAGCYAVTFAANAAAKGIELGSLSLELEADFNLHGFLGLDPDIRPGAQQVRVMVHATSPNATTEQLEELTELVQQRSPIRDTLAGPVAVLTTLAPDPTETSNAVSASHSAS